MADAQEQVGRWRQMAEECRTKAEQLTDAGARSSFLHMARTYDNMADRYMRLAASDRLESFGNPEQAAPTPPAESADEAGQRRR
jgi:hypothetical protein